MPARDKTGPNGMGPMTGRGAGICTSADAPTNENFEPGTGYGQGRGLGRGQGRGLGRGQGRGLGRGQGRGLGRGQGFGGPADSTETSSVSTLKAQFEMLEGQLKKISDQIETLSSEKDE